MTYNSAWLPLFPLKTVLFPGGVLPLKVFETRYVDMVRSCANQGVPFGVVLIRAAQESGRAVALEAVGCVAHVAQWDMVGPDVMLLRMHGRERFRILETRALADQRLEARIELIATDRDVPISGMHVSCAKALKIVIDDVDAKRQAAQGDSFHSPFARPIHLESAGWVANRWCEILPIPLQARQKLLEVDDPGSRLSIVHQYLQQHKIL